MSRLRTAALIWLSHGPLDVITTALLYWSLGGPWAEHNPVMRAALADLGYHALLAKLALVTVAAAVYPIAAHLGGFRDDRAGAVLISIGVAASVSNAVQFVDLIELPELLSIVLEVIT